MSKVKSGIKSMRKNIHPFGTHLFGPKGRTNIFLVRDYLLSPEREDRDIYNRITVKDLRAISDILHLKKKNKKTKKELWDAINVYKKEFIKTQDFSNLSYDGRQFPIDSEDGLKFVIVPKGFTIYKAMPLDFSESKENSNRSDFEEYMKKGDAPFPSFFSTKEVADIYNQTYFNGNGIIKEYKLTRALKLFLLNDHTNILNLAFLFWVTLGVKGFLESSNVGAIKELFMITGFHTHYREQDKFKKKVEKKIDAEFDDYDLDTDFCDKLGEGELKRLSIYGVDLKFSQNVCITLRRYGCEGYIARDMPICFGEEKTFHSEIMLCLTCNNLPF